VGSAYQQKSFEAYCFTLINPVKLRYSVIRWFDYIYCQTFFVLCSRKIRRSPILTHVQ